MSMGATLSIMGLYNYDNTVLDLMQFPEGMTAEEKQTIKDNILVECAELEFLYPSPVVAKSIIGIWSKKELPYWQRVYNASTLEYNPIENYRRNETETIEDDRTESHSGNDVNRASGTDSQNGTSEVTTTDSGTDTTTNTITGYDSNTLVPRDSSALVHGMIETTDTEGSNSTTYGRTDTFTHGEG